jgi:hypothetical protein
MKTPAKMKSRMLTAVVMAATLIPGCTNDLTRNESPVELIVTNTQNLFVIDTSGGTGCDELIGTIEMKSVLKGTQGPIGDQRFNDVRVFRYQVSYVRTDGGRTVPAPFVQSIDTLLTTGGSPQGSNFLVFREEALSQAPFAALQPQNGGRDPDTGSRFVRMDVVLTVFGRTLAGEDVSGTTRIPLEFCFDCGGCH